MCASSVGRPPRPGDVIVVPEGHENPLVYARPWLSGGQLVLLLLGPLGLLGWPFVSGWTKPSPLTATAEDVNRPESFKALAEMSIPVWSNARVIVNAARASGVNASFVGEGQAMPYPEPAEARPVDVAWLADNRWASIARPLAERLTCVVDAIETVDHAEMLRRLGRARVLLYPARIEGESRVLREARKMGTVPVVVTGNPVATQASPSDGVIAVDDRESMPEVITALLSDPERLASLSRAAISRARAGSLWEPFVARVANAFRSLPPPDPATGARAVIGERLGHEIDELASDLEGSRATVGQLIAACEANDELARELGKARTRMVELDLELDRVPRRKDEAEAELKALRDQSIVRCVTITAKRTPRGR